MNEEHNAEALDLRAYLRPIWRRKWVILAIVVIAAAATYFISARQPKQYVASTKLYVQVADPTQDIAGAGAQGAPSSQSLADVAQLVLDQSVTGDVAKQLGRLFSSAGSVTATPVPGSDFLTVTATGQHPALAARLANTYVSTFLSNRSRAVKSKALQDQRAAQTALSTLSTNRNNPNDAGQRQTVLQQIESYKQIGLNPSAGASQVDPAIVPTHPTSPRPTRDAIFGGAVGLVLGLIAAFCIELLDRRLARVAIVESGFGRPVLAVLPHVRDPTPLLDRTKPVVPPEFVEELRTLTVILRLAGSAGPPRTIMVTSTLPREGKSTVTRHLALVYAESGQRVLVIDGDLRRPSMERLFGIEAKTGLVQILRGEASLSEAAIVAVGTRREDAEPSTNGSVPTLPSHHRALPGDSSEDAPSHASDDGDTAEPPVPSLVVEEPDGEPGTFGSVDVVAHGERLANPLPLLASERMVALFEESSKVYDIILLDTPPMLAVADSMPLMEVVDSVLLVARLGKTTMNAAERFTELVQRLPDINFSGVIANDKRGKLGEDGYGSFGRYGYGYGEVSDRKRKQKAGTTAS